MNQLTKKEIEIINLFTNGLNNEEIAQKLSISKHSTNQYVSNIYNKLTLHNNLKYNHLF